MDSTKFEQDTVLKHGQRKPYGSLNYKVVRSSNIEHVAIVRFGENFYNTDDHNENETLITIANTSSYLILDMGRVTHIDAAATRVILKLKKTLQNRNGALFLARPNQFVRGIFSILGIENMLNIVPSVSAAMRSLEMDI